MKIHPDSHNSPHRHQRHQFSFTYTQMHRLIINKKLHQVIYISLVGTKIFGQTLDNRYTDVVSLQCKIHESTNTIKHIINHLKHSKRWQEM